MKDERILIVDDEAPMLHSVCRVLASKYEVATARTAGEALDTAREHAPDLAILDIRMPEKDGFELMGELREVCPDVDVVFMTGALHEVDAQLLRSIRERAFYFIQKPFDREVLLTLVQRCFDQRRLARENRAHVERLEDELAEARQFQQSLLPGDRARIGGVQIAALYRPCAAMGGDFYDFVDAGAGRAAVLMADVSGHGVSAAMLTGIVKAAFHDAHAEAFRPADVARRVAGALRTFDDGRFVTLFCARIDRERAVVEYANAGHPPALHWSPGAEPREIGITGPMISPAFPDLSWREERFELAPGDRLLLYTDGVPEARDRSGFFGEDRLRDIVERSANAGNALLDEIVASVEAFSAGRPAEDDLTLLTVST